MNTNTTIIYITREIERALGTVPSEHYYIISNKTRYGETIKAQYTDFVILIDSQGKDLLGTTDLLGHTSTKELISKLDSLPPDQKSPVSILVFKNTIRVETSAKLLNSTLLNPTALLSERVENKISQLRWLGTLGTKYLPPHAAKVVKMITWKGENPFIIQWNHGHTGDGTMLIKTVDDLRAVQEKFPERIARISAFVNGPSFTVNVVVTASRILIGNISYQITGMQPFTDGTFSTVGNDWSLAKKLLSPEDMKAVETMANEIGNKLQTDGWRGLYGIDFIKYEKTGKIFLIEINARQPASTTFESALQEKAREKGARGLTIFEAHIRALCGLPIDQDMIQIEGGAQVIQRVTKNVQEIFDDISTSLQKLNYKVVAYQNTGYNADLLRIQSDQGIMEDHGSFNTSGREIAEAIKSAHFKIEI
ncbi:MAG: ATP-grasp domain-containing protein [Candidatus Taylorbacteria bacterium]